MSDFTRQSHALFGRLGPGSRIAGYRIEEQVGAGGMAVVFRARDEALGRVAAVKVIAPQVAGDEEFRARFLRESRAAARVDSPYIVPVYGAGEEGGLLYIAMRFVAGGDLDELLRRSGGRLAAGAAAALVGQVASALDAAHAAGLAHRDVKLANVLVDDVLGLPGHVYLADFGLSKALASTGLTAPGQFVGTPNYSAPEQIRGAVVDGRADQYALGCVAFALLTGAPPFQRASAAATLFGHLQAPVPAVTRQRPDLPAAVDGVIARALAKSPQDRYGRCGEFAAALREALRQPLPPAGPVTVHAGAGGPAQAVRAPAAGGGSTWDAVTARGATAGRGPGPGRGRGRAVWAAGSAAVLAAGALTAWVVLQPPPAKHGPAAGHSSSSPGPGNALARADVNGPSAIAADGTHIWVTSFGGDSVTELDASSGSLTRRTLSGGRYGFDWPDAIAVDGGHVWVANYAGSLTELDASSGSWIRTLKDISYVGGNGIPAIAVDGGHIWVTNPIGDSVTELDASDGRWIRTLKGSRYGFSAPGAIAVDGTHIWVANQGGDSVTELDASDGSWIRTLSGGSYGFSQPEGIAVDGGHVWVTNEGGDSVTELDASDGSWVRTLSGGSYGFNGPYGIAVDDDHHIWVANQGADSVTELDASDGSLIRTVSGSSYGFNGPDAVAVDGTHIWVANSDGQISETELPSG